MRCLRTTRQLCIPQRQKPRATALTVAGRVADRAKGEEGARGGEQKPSCLADLVLHDVVVRRFAGVRAVLVSARHHVRAVDRAKLRLMLILLASVVAVLVVGGLAGGESGGRGGCECDCEESAFHDYVPFGWLRVTTLQV